MVSVPYPGTCILIKGHSYQVPKEVGKVGTESSTFVEPVSQRRDGIEAMFAKQSKTYSQPSNSQSSPKKRKADDIVDSQPPQPLKKARKGVTHEVVDLCSSDEDRKGKSTTAEKMNTWEDDGEVEYIDQPKDNARSKVSVSIIFSCII